MRNFLAAAVFAASVLPAHAGGFPVCTGGKRVNCVVDGDTFWLAGVKIRVADINTPEVSEPACAAEAALGARATHRFQFLLNAGPFEVRRGWRDEDVFGRKLRTLYRDGESIGAILVAAGCEVTLHHLDGVLRHAATVITRTLPVAIGDFRDDFATFLDRFQYRSDIEMAIQRALDSDFDVIEIDEHS